MFVKKRGFGKKAILGNVLFFLIDLIILVIVFFLMLWYVDQVVESTTFEKNFLARDSALLIDALYASPGNIAIDYPQNTFWFSFNFDKNKVEVYEAGSSSIRKPDSYFIEDKNIKFEHKEIKPEREVENKESIIEKYFTPLSYFYTSGPDLEEGTFVRLIFGKIGKEIIVDEQGKIELEDKLLECPDVKEDGTPAGAQPVYIRPIINPGTLTQDEINSVRGASVSILTFLGDYPDENINDIRAYISSSEGKEKSKRLACLILNNIIKNDELKAIIKNNNLLGITGIGISPTDSWSVVDEGNVVVILKIGNINIENDKNIIRNDEARAAIDSSINRAVEEILR